MLEDLTRPSLDPDTSADFHVPCSVCRCGSWFGKICCCIAAVDDMYWRWLRWWCPDSIFEIAPDHPSIAQASRQ